MFVRLVQDDWILYDYLYFYSKYQKIISILIIHLIILMLIYSGWHKLSFHIYFTLLINVYENYKISFQK